MYSLNFPLQLAVCVCWLVYNSIKITFIYKYIFYNDYSSGLIMSHNLETIKEQLHNG